VQNLGSVMTDDLKFNAAGVEEALLKRKTKD
jgi:hypothetical protein